MKILLLNQNWFQAELRSFGHEVISCGADSHFDVRLNTPMLTIQEASALTGMKPDRIVLFDNSLPVLVKGLEAIETPILFYSIDAQHHANLHRLLARTFDFTLVAQKDYLERFPAATEWMPLWAPRYVEPSKNKKHRAVFVGTMDPLLNPERVRFFSELSTLTPIECLKGEYWNIFPYSGVVVNQTVKSDLNFRVFEALMCGAALLTEDIQNGFHELFEPGKHLEVYRRGDARDAASKINSLLSNPERTKTLGEAGRAVILASHTAAHRAKRIHEILNRMKKREKPSRYSLAANFTILGDYFEENKNSLARQAYAESLRLIEEGLRNSEPLDQDLASEVLQSCSSFDRVNPTSPRGANLIDAFCGAYPAFFSKNPS